MRRGRPCRRAKKAKGPVETSRDGLLAVMYSQTWPRRPPVPVVPAAGLRKVLTSTGPARAAAVAESCCSSIYTESAESSILAPFHRLEEEERQHHHQQQQQQQQPAADAWGSASELGDYMAELPAYLGPHIIRSEGEDRPAVGLAAAPVPVQHVTAEQAYQLSGSRMSSQCAVEEAASAGAGADADADAEEAKRCSKRRSFWATLRIRRKASSTSDWDGGGGGGGSWREPRAFAGDGGCGGWEHVRPGGGMAPVAEAFTTDRRPILGVDIPDGSHFQDEFWARFPTHQLSCK
ncbi:uncharacterized protein UV8b_07153 [Ustilaginoidea virens]|uniref:Uncharacterized protein n=1 Tax=Ustilaginoidea virens TaxID=1159556 RepID=A0A063BQV1_USTVR|nr:uncharacterized protein UV8b_07153 [Ustilaginoidea virens]QUC22912.1 hypothetical protein UV8b_07153 [Ustilaginoidea virens]GAO18717.1 hypothetical protein UVI_02047250 [Ustilaginoidea virens]